MKNLIFIATLLFVAIIMGVPSSNANAQEEEDQIVLRRFNIPYSEKVQNFLLD